MSRSILITKKLPGLCRTKGILMILPQSPSQRGALKIGSSLGIGQQLFRSQTSSSGTEGGQTTGADLIARRSGKGRSHTHDSHSFRL